MQVINSGQTGSRRGTFAASTLIGAEESIRRLNEDEVFILKPIFLLDEAHPFSFSSSSRRKPTRVSESTSSPECDASSTAHPT